MKVYSRVSVPISSGELHIAQSSQFLLLVLYLPFKKGHWGCSSHIEAGHAWWDGVSIHVLHGGQDVTNILQHLSVTKHVLTVTWRLGET